MEETISNIGVDFINTPSLELTYFLSLTVSLEDDFPFPTLGYVSFRKEGMFMQVDVCEPR